MEDFRLNTSLLSFVSVLGKTSRCISEEGASGEMWAVDFKKCLHSTTSLRTGGSLFRET